MTTEPSDIPVVEFEHEVLEASLTAEGNLLGRLIHDGVTYRILMRPVKRDSGFWAALMQINAGGKLKIIAFRLAPDHQDLTTAYESTTGDTQLDMVALMGLLAEIPGSGVEMVKGRN